MPPALHQPIIAVDFRRRELVDAAADFSPPQLVLALEIFGRREPRGWPPPHQQGNLYETR
jgi:hypothetical protein